MVRAAEAPMAEHGSLQSQKIIVLLANQAKSKSAMQKTAQKSKQKLAQTAGLWQKDTIPLRRIQSTIQIPTITLSIGNPPDTVFLILKSPILTIGLRTIPTVHPNSNHTEVNPCTIVRKTTVLKRYPSSKNALSEAANLYLFGTVMHTVCVLLILGIASRELMEPAKNCVAPPTVFLNTYSTVTG